MSSAEERRERLRQALRFQESGQWDMAKRIYLEVLERYPDDFNALHMLGVIALENGATRDALDMLKRAVALRPEVAEAQGNLGYAYLRLGCDADALDALDRALDLRADFPQAHNNRALVLLRLGQAEAALANLDQAIRLLPDFAEAYDNRGNALAWLGRHDEALANYRRALALAPGLTLARVNMGQSLSDQGRETEALACYAEVLAEHPEHAEARFNMGLSLLRLGRYAEAWPLYEWRWRRAAAAGTGRDLQAPLWTGATPVAGKTILLHAEFGFGDTLQFCRYASKVAALGARVVLEVDRPMLGLLRSLDGVAEWLARGDALPVYDVHCPLMSLPLAFRTDAGSIPAEVPYLAADPALLAEWSTRLGRRLRPRVGVAWSGNPSHLNDRNRSLSFAEFAAMLPADLGIDYHSLQREVRVGDLAALHARPDIRHWGGDLTDFGDTAALCQLMDVVISVDTSVAHLAGALARPLWLLLPANADWRWQREREDSPWYPTARLYRQRQPGDWGEPMRRIVGDLRASLMALRAPSWQGWLDQALAHHRQGQLGAAERVYRQVVAAQPEHFDAWHLLGVVAAQQGRHAEAVAHFDHALTLRPDATAYINRASLYERIGRLEDALSDYEMAQALIPAEASLPFRRGNVLLALGRDIDAVSAYDQSLELVADDAEVHFNRGYALRRLNRLDEALTAYGLALTYRPEHVSAYRNRANLLRHLGRREEALADYRHAIDLRPDYARTYAHIAQTLAELGRLEESMCSFDQALKRDPEHAETHLKRAFLRLQMGQFRTGWQEHEWRWRTAHGQAARRDFAQPIWLGDFSLAGRTILLHAEFGLGDTLQFCRYAKQVSALGATVILEAQAPLIGLLSTLDGVDRLVARGDPLPDFDCHCPLMSLPLAFQTDASSIPSATAYLRADPDHMARWTERLGTKRALRIGIVWSGNPKHGDDYKRSLHLADFVRGLPKGAECYGLQKDIRAQDRETLEIYPDIVFLGDQIADFADTAALCELMDVIVSVDTSVAHLAGALGRPLWLLLPFNPDWRWLLDRDDSPWYPSARLFRQPKLGDWPSLLANVREKLQRFANPPGD